MILVDPFQLSLFCDHSRLGLHSTFAQYSKPGIRAWSHSLTCLYIKVLAVGRKWEELEVWMHLQGYDFAGVIVMWRDSSHEWTACSILHNSKPEVSLGDLQRYMPAAAIQSPSDTFFTVACSRWLHLTVPLFAMSPWCWDNCCSTWVIRGAVFYF